MTIQEDQQAVLDLGLGSKMACPGCGGKGRTSYRDKSRTGYIDHPDCNGTGEVPTPLGHAVVLAVSEESPSVDCLTCKHARTNHKIKLSAIRDWRVHNPVPCDEAGCDCVEYLDDGTGRTLIPIDMADTEAGRRSRAEACGRLIAVFKSADQDTLSTGMGEPGFEECKRGWRALTNLDVAAAMSALRELMEVMQ